MLGSVRPGTSGAGEGDGAGLGSAPDGAAGSRNAAGGVRSSSVISSLTGNVIDDVLVQDSSGASANVGTYCLADQLPWLPSRLTFSAFGATISSL